jgi:hypothetical protein
MTRAIFTTAACIAALTTSLYACSDDESDTGSSTTSTTSASGGSGQGGGTTSTGGSTSGNGGAGGGGTAACGDMGLMCSSSELCVRFVMTAGPSETITWECHPDTCAPNAPDCSCAMTICSGGGVGALCQLNMGQLECYSGGVCASPDTPIATPFGERAISELRVGDLVMSMHRDQLQAVPLLRATKTAVRDHAVVELTLSNGATLQISGAHPTADGRLLQELLPGASLGGTEVLSAATLPYQHAHTYDILPDSDSGSYVAGGALIGTTLR